MTEAGVPQDRTLDEVSRTLNRYRDRDRDRDRNRDAPGRRVETGETTQFVPEPGGVVRCSVGGHRFNATELNADHVVRTEGASDPDDMAITLESVCPRCGRHGALVLHFGPLASAEELDVLAAVGPRH